MNFFATKPALIKTSVVFALAMLTAEACTPVKPENSEPRIINSSLKGVDLQSQGEFSFTAVNYGLPAEIDPKVDAIHPTDVRGKIYLPNGSGPFPLLVFLHGNHQTCDKIQPDSPSFFGSTHFTYNGTCLPGWAEAPSYLGYEYLANNLATHGYAVVSINANRGVTGRNDGPDGDQGLIKARGALVLKHLAKLSGWNAEGAPTDALPLDIKGKLDFAHVGFMGHSRGGEGVRAAYDLFKRKDPGTYADAINQLNVEGILELAPVDGFTDEKFNVDGTNWAVVIASCDGDVADFQGTDTFGRRRGQNASSFSGIFTVPGGNHNNFNTEWQSPDTYCTSGEKELAAPDQRAVSLMLHNAFFRGFVGTQKSESLQNVFDPQYHVPDQISNYITSVRESLDASMVKVTEVASQARPVAFQNQTIDARQLTRLEWQRAEGPAVETYYESRLFNAGTDVSMHDVISLSVAPFMKSRECQEQGSCADSAVPDLTISLVGQDGSVSSAVALSDYVSGMILNREHQSCEGIMEPYVYPGTCLSKEPVAQERCYTEFRGVMEGDRCMMFLENSSKRLLFYEVPIELKDFGSFDLKTFVGVRLNLNKSESGGLYLDKTAILRSNR